MHAALADCVTDGVTDCVTDGVTDCVTHLLPGLHGFDEFKAGVMRIEGISEAPQQLPIVTAGAKAEV